MVELRSKLLAIGVDNYVADEDQAKSADIAVKVCRLESRAAATPPPDFAGKVKTLLESVSTQFTGKITTIDAPFQADPCLAKLALGMEVEAIVSADSDFAMCIGGGADGKSDIVLKPEVVGNTIRSCQLSTGQSTTKNFIDGFGHPWANVPKHPFFDGVAHEKVRALCALAIGCDANPGGVHGFGPAKVSELIEPDDCFADLVDKLSKNFGCKKPSCEKKHSHVSSVDAWNCLVDSMIHEPTHAGPLHSEPTELASYNREYAYEGTTVFDGPPTATCRGCPGQAKPHSFLSEEGVHLCSNCSQPICRSCICDNGLCVSCSHDKLAG